MPTPDPAFQATSASAAPGLRAHPEAGREAGARSVSSEQLFAGRNEIQITHGSSIYRLRLTSLGKLILTK